MKARTSRPGRGSGAGFSLIEVMVALFVLSIGVLSVVGLQGVSKRNNMDASQRTYAAQLAHELLERMRANDSNGARLAYEIGASSGLGGGKIGTPSETCDDHLNPCSQIQLANYDLWDWERRLDGKFEVLNGVDVGGLVDPTACLQGPGGGLPGVYTVTIVWRGNAASTNPSGVNASCGNTANRYGVDNVYRRVVSVQTFLF